MYAELHLRTHGGFIRADHAQVYAELHLRTLLDFIRADHAQVYGELHFCTHFLTSFVLTMRRCLESCTPTHPVGVAEGNAAVEEVGGVGSTML